MGGGGLLACSDSNSRRIFLRKVWGGLLLACSNSNSRRIFLGKVWGGGACWIVLTPVVEEYF
jgi:hypothetical protein